MGCWPGQAEKDCRSFGYSENLLPLVAWSKIQRKTSTDCGAWNNIAVVQGFLFYSLITNAI